MAQEQRLPLTDELRFQLELEFVQLLANPSYIKFLVEFRYVQDPTFQRFLKYLRYWRRPEYARFVLYPHALYFLDALTNPLFCAELQNNLGPLIECISFQQFRHWQTYLHNRLGFAVRERPVEVPSRAEPPASASPAP